jgi:hypothetical protein
MTTNQKIGVGWRLAMPFIGLLVGIPVLAGVLIESAIVATVTGWDLWTIFAVQAVPMTGFAVLASIGMAVRGQWPDQ